MTCVPHSGPRQWRVSHSRTVGNVAQNFARRPGHCSPPLSHRTSSPDTAARARLHFPRATADVPSAHMPKPTPAPLPRPSTPRPSPPRALRCRLSTSTSRSACPLSSTRHSCHRALRACGSASPQWRPCTPSTSPDTCRRTKPTRARFRSIPRTSRGSSSRRRPRRRRRTRRRGPSRTAMLLRTRICWTRGRSSCWLRPRRRTRCIWRSRSRRTTPESITRISTASRLRTRWVRRRCTTTCGAPCRHRARRTRSKALRATARRTVRRCLRFATIRTPSTQYPSALSLTCS